jgi:hypothetical protein
MRKGVFMDLTPEEKLAKSVVFRKVAALKPLKYIKSEDCKFINERKVKR